MSAELDDGSLTNGIQMGGCGEVVVSRVGNCLALSLKSNLFAFFFYRLLSEFQCVSQSVRLCICFFLICVVIVVCVLV